MDTCRIEGCPEPVFVKVRGWCRRHYHRWYRTGDPLKAAYERIDGPPLERWWAKVEKTDTCWLWRGNLDRHGYGQFGALTDGERRNHRAHRWGYQQLVRPLDANETLDHLCRVHACVNPDHLEPVSHAENVARGDSGKHNADKTHCPRGHEYTEANTYRPKRGGRECRTCMRDRSRATMRRRRAAAKAASM
jgi:hypothetical protein